MKITKTTTPKQKPDENNLGFGKYFTDHMLIMNYEEGKGWFDARIVPYGPLTIDPSTMILHYGQTVFEGMKAYRAADGRVLMFRPQANLERINISNERMCIPAIDVDYCLNLIFELVKLERDWIPSAEGTSLYIRPFIIGTDAVLGVHPSKTYMFIVILSPVGAYYPGGLDPVKIYIEDEYVRAVKGGTGFAKTAGNYASSLKAQDLANKKGYTQVLWLDGAEHKYIEEVGAMNVFFKIGNEVVTPALNGSILAGITRNSVIEVLKSFGENVVERKISIDELISAHENNTLIEAFGTGTAAVISPMGTLNYKGKELLISGGKIGSLSQKLYDTLTGIQWGRIKDSFGWTVEL